MPLVPDLVPFWILSRDFKPFQYSFHTCKILFASEIKAHAHKHNTLLEEVRHLMHFELCAQRKEKIF